jgi:hypothetical protein
MTRTSTVKGLKSKVLQRIAWLILIFAIFLLGDRLAGSVLEQLLLKSGSRYSALYRGNTANDILVLGNSRGVNAFYQPDIEKQTGQRVFNLSYNGLSSLMAFTLLADYLEHNPAPRLLLLELSFLGEPKPLSQETLDNFKPFSLFSPRLQTLQGANSPNSLFFCRVSHLYCFNSEMYLRTLYYLGKNDQTWINRYSISQEVIATIEAVEPFSLELPEAQLEVLQAILGVARSHTITVKLVMSPYFPAYAERITNMSDWLSQIELASGLPVLDYSKTVTDPYGFSDRRHMNPQGSAILLEQMIQEGVFN